jgi:hypothetical protein
MNAEQYGCKLQAFPANRIRREKFTEPTTSHVYSLLLELNRSYLRRRVTKADMRKFLRKYPVDYVAVDTQILRLLKIQQTIRNTTTELCNALRLDHITDNIPIPPKIAENDSELHTFTVADSYRNTPPNLEFFKVVYNDFHQLLDITQHEISLQLQEKQINNVILRQLKAEMRDIEEDIQNLDADARTFEQ